MLLPPLPATMKLKCFWGALLIVSLVFLPGCMTAFSRNAARGFPSPADTVEPEPSRPKHPALYLLLPITLPLDAVFFPLEYAFYVSEGDSEHKSVKDFLCSCFD